MIGAVVLSVLLAGQFPSETSPQAIDWAFAESQERWVADQAGGPCWALESAPDRVSYILWTMNSDDWRQREWASGAMLAMGDDAVRWCLLGQRLGMPEVWLRCRNILRRLSACQMCDGQGTTRETWGLTPCRVCHAVGHFWPLEDFD